MDLDQQVRIVLDEQGKEVVQIDIDVFKAIESYIEDYGLAEAVFENNSSDNLQREDALEFYSKLKKSE